MVMWWLCSTRFVGLPLKLVDWPVKMHGTHEQCKKNRAKMHEHIFFSKKTKPRTVHMRLNSKSSQIS